MQAHEHELIPKGVTGSTHTAHTGDPSHSHQTRSVKLRLRYGTTVYRGIGFMKALVDTDYEHQHLSILMPTTGETTPANEYIEVD